MKFITPSDVNMFTDSQIQHINNILKNATMNYQNGLRSNIFCISLTNCQDIPESSLRYLSFMLKDEGWDVMFRHTHAPYIEVTLPKRKL
jgi:hypothetical protein